MGADGESRRARQLSSELSKALAHLLLTHAHAPIQPEGAVKGLRDEARAVNSAEVMAGRALRWGSLGVPAWALGPTVR